MCHMFQKYQIAGLAYDGNRLGALRHKFEDWYAREQFDIFGTYDTFTWPMNVCEGLIDSKRLVWHYNPVTAWNFANCGVKVAEGPIPKCMPTRGVEHLKIDGVVAFLNALKAALMEEDPIRASDLEGWYD